MALTQVQGGMILPSTTLTTPIVATTMGVGGATPSTSGSGITFPATQSASTNANTLDDYEEGTWTPGWNGGTISSYSRCQYVKIGGQVTVTGDIAFGTPSGSAAITITGMPFNTAGGTGNQAVGSIMENFCGLAGNSYVTPYFYGGDGNLNFYMSNSGGGWATQNNNLISNTSRIIFTITYFAGV